jgi:hypothetical protein
VPDLLRPRATVKQSELFSWRHARLDELGELDEPWTERYRLRARISAGPDDECFVAALAYHGLVFIRRFPGACFSELLAPIKRLGQLHREGVEIVFELSKHGDHGYVVTELVEGLDLDELDDALRRRGERLPWRLALAMLHDAWSRATYLQAAGALQGNITPARLRLGLAGRLYLCHGMPATTQPAWRRVVCDVVRPILRLAASDEEDALLGRLLDDNDEDDLENALAVASDALLAHHRDLDPLLPLLLEAALEDGALAMDRAAKMISAALPQRAVDRLWHFIARAIGAPWPEPG